MAIGSTVGHAQENPGVEEIFELSPFIVETSAQRGYLATNSNSGTRLSEKIKDLPIPVEIITGQFIEDIGALDVKESLQFSAGLETEITSVQIGENTSNPNAFRLRGYVSEAVMRNGFRVIGATDSVNVAQVDVVRGPNALLYGIGNFGGVVNYITARPMPEFRSSVALTVGSWDFLRVQARAQGPAGDKNGYAIGGFWQEGDAWYDNGDSTKKGGALLWEFRPTKKTTITFDSEYIFQRNHSAENPLGTDFLGDVVDGPFIDGSEHPTFVLDQFGNNYWADPNTHQGFLVRPSDEFRWGGIDDYNEVTDLSLMLGVIHQFSAELSLQAGYNYVKRDQFKRGLTIDYAEQAILQDTAEGERLRAAYPWLYLPQHPDYTRWSAPGYRALSYNWSQSENIQEWQMIRAELAWNKVLWGVRNTVIVGTTYNYFEPNQGAGFALKDSARPPVSPTVNDQSGLQGARNRLKSIFDYTPIFLELSETEAFVQTHDYRKPDKFWENGYYFIHQGRFFNERLHTVLGIRYDSIDTAKAQYWNFNDEGYVDGTLGELREYRHRADGPSRDTNTSIGVSYTVSDAISLFVLRASALQPVYNQTTPEGTIPDPQTGISYELGMKFDMLDSRISGAVSFYSIERDGVPRRTGAVTYPRDDPTSVDFDPDWGAQGRGTSNDFGFMQDTSEGVDLQVFFTDLIEGLQTVVNFSYNDYVWERFYGSSFVRKEGSGADAVFVFEEVDYSSEINPNRKFNDTPDFSVRIWNKYQFGEGFLEGFDVGLGMNWTDRREATYSLDGNPILASLKIIPDRFVWSAAVGYSGEIRGLEVSARLNVYNLLDDDTVLGYSYQTPRNYRLTVSVSF